jgi:hypothetical protein
MLIHPMHIDIARQRQREERKAARQRRLVAGLQPERRIRRAVGRSMVRIGSRLAAERARPRARSL